MKVAVTAINPDPETEIDPRFGRCFCFFIYDTDDMSFETLMNNPKISGGAGIQAATLLAQKKVKVVLTGNCGPNAHRTLSAAGIDVITGCKGSAREAIMSYKSGILSPSDKANVDEHHGMTE